MSAELTKIGRELRLACWHRDAARVQFLLQSGANPNEHDADRKESALLVAAEKGDVGIIDLLVAHGADLGHVNRWGRGALHYAARSRNKNVVAYLIDVCGMNPCCADEDGVTPLMIAAQHDEIDIVRIMINGGADLLQPDRHGQTVFHYASIFASPALLAELIAHDRRGLDSRDHRGKTPLLLAAEYGNDASIDVLVTNGADVNQTDQNGRCALHYAVEWYHRKTVVRLLIRYGLDPNSTDADEVAPVLSAAKNGDWRMIETLFGLGANIKIADGRRRNALHYAVECDQRECVEVLIDYFGFDPNCCDKNGVTPIMIAAERGRIDIIDALLKRGANPFMRDNTRRNAVKIAKETLLNAMARLRRTSEIVL